jgi:hypothetical protein
VSTVVPARMRTLVIALFIALPLIGAGPAAGATVSGAMWQDADADGVFDAGETPLSGRRVYLTDPSGMASFGVALTSSGGRYSLNNVDNGDYRVELDPSQWNEIKHDWVPTTTGSVWPRKALTVSGDATVDFGWRTITRSATPVSTYAAPNGLRVEAYSDALSARQVADRLLAGTLVGEEAAVTTFKFDLGQSTHAEQSVNGAEGSYSNYRADVQIAWGTYLDQGDRVLFHEYGHAWAGYYGYLFQQTSRLDGYLSARGIAKDDPRLNTTHAWTPTEMIAEDYRQLFGAGDATQGQENTEIPRAADVPGLRDYLAVTFRTRVATAPPPADPTPTPTPTTEPSPAPSVTGLAMNPNTVKTSGTASFNLSIAAKVTVSIRDAKGALVRTLLSGANRGAGNATASWDRTNARGQRVKGGTYSVLVEAVAADGRSTSASSSFKVS